MIVWFCWLLIKQSDYGSEYVIYDFCFPEYQRQISCNFDTDFQCGYRLTNLDKSSLYWARRYEGC